MGDWSQQLDPEVCRGSPLEHVSGDHGTAVLEQIHSISLRISHATCSWSSGLVFLNSSVCVSPSCMVTSTTLGKEAWASCRRGHGACFLLSFFLLPDPPE